MVEISSADPRVSCLAHIKDPIQAVIGSFSTTVKGGAEMAGRPVSTIKNKDGKTVGRKSKPVLVDITMLTNNPGEPPVRIDWDNPKSKAELTTLMNLIKKYDMLEPVTITSGLMIIDGHRRTAVCKELGYTEIQANIIPDQQAVQDDEDFDPFVMLNSSKKALDGHQYLWRYMNGHSLPDLHLSRIKSLEKWVGTRSKYMFQKILATGGSPATYSFAMGIYRKQLKRNSTYKKKLQKAHMNDLVEWMFNVGSPSNIKYAVYNLIPIETLVDCIDNRKTIGTEFKAVVTKPGG